MHFPTIPDDRSNPFLLPCLLAFFPPHFQLEKAVKQRDFNDNISKYVRFLEVLIYTYLRIYSIHKSIQGAWKFRLPMRHWQFAKYTASIGTILTTRQRLTWVFFNCISSSHLLPLTEWKLKINKQMKLLCLFLKSLLQHPKTSCSLFRKCTTDFWEGHWLCSCFLWSRCVAALIYSSSSSFF